MDLNNIIASIVIALIAAGGSYLGYRATAKAEKHTVDTTSRVEMEKDAFQRARAFDIQTIERQDREMEELVAANQELKQKNDAQDKEINQLHIENRDLRNKNDALERKVDHPENRISRLEKEKGA